MASPSRRTVRSRAARRPATRCSPASAPRTARARRKCRCATWCSRGSSRSRAAPIRNISPTISPCSTSRCRRPRWPSSIASGARTSASSARRTPRNGMDEGAAAMHAVEANGARIPLLGFGTWDLRGRTCARIVEQALRLGYRHIDTAQIYDNEREVGEGLRASGLKRDEVFVTTKIWPSHFAPRDFERSAKECLVHLRLSAVDLLLMHWPNPHIPLAETLGALCKLKREGLARHIGVSNFTVAMIEEATALSSEPLACNQVEVHPFLDQTKVIEACRAHGL